MFIKETDEQIAARVAAFRKNLIDQLAMDAHFTNLVKNDPTLFKAAKTFLLVNNRGILPRLSRDVLSVVWKHMIDGAEIRYVLGGLLDLYLIDGKPVKAPVDYGTPGEYVARISTEAIQSKIPTGDVVLYKSINDAHNACKSIKVQYLWKHEHHPPVAREQPIYAVTVDKSNIVATESRETAHSEHLSYHRVCIPSYRGEYENSPQISNTPTSKCIIA